MASMSRRQSIRTVIAAALATASAPSLINYALASTGTVTVETSDGRTLEITSNAKASIVRVLGTNAAPTGTIVLKNGQTLAVANGVVTGGTSVTLGRANWAAFALMPADLQGRVQAPASSAPASMGWGH